MSDDRIVFECDIAEEVALNDLAEPGQEDEQLSTNETTTDKDDDRIVFEDNMQIEDPIRDIKNNSIQEGPPEQNPNDDFTSDGGRKLKNETWRTQPANDEDDLTSDGGRKLKNTTWHAQSAPYTESAPPDDEDRIVYED